MAADPVTAELSLYDHNTAPVAFANAYMYVFPAPMYTVPSAPRIGVADTLDEVE